MLAHEGAKVTLSASEPKPSFQAEMGLKAFKDNKWPDRIVVGSSANSEKAAEIAGTYVRRGCRGTCVQGGLWKRSADSMANSPMYLMIQPEPERTAKDKVVFSASAEWRHFECVVAEVRATFWLHEVSRCPAHFSRTRGLRIV